MALYDVYANPDASERRSTPYFLDVQNDHLGSLATRVVVPLRRESAFGPRALRLNPLVMLGAEALVLDTAALGAVPQAELRKTVGRLGGSERPEIHEALDTLFGGF